MKTTKIVKKEIEIEEITDICCNKCGDSLKKSDTNYEGYGYHGLKEVQAYFGYGSGFDGDELTFSLCQRCSFKLICSFKIDPVFSGVNSGDCALKDIFKNIESIYGFKKENNTTSNDETTFLSKDELEKLQNYLAKEVKDFKKKSVKKQK